jgi:hypothetical protein
MTKQHFSEDEIKEATKTFYKIDNLDKQNVPQNIDIGNDKIPLKILTAKEMKVELVKKILEDPELKYEYDINDANEIARLLVDEEYDFNVALEEVDNSKTNTQETAKEIEEEQDEQKTHEGRVPWPES